MGFDKLNNDIDNSINKYINIPNFDINNLDNFKSLCLQCLFFLIIYFIVYLLLVQIASYIEKLKKQYLITISYDKLTYFDEGYKIKLTNFFKSIRGSIGSDIVSIEVKKENTKIVTNVYTNSLRLNKIIENELRNIDGFDLFNHGLIEKNVIKNNKDSVGNSSGYKNKRLLVNSIFTRHSHFPINFNQSNSLEKLFSTLENIEYGGFQITFRGVNKLWFYRNEINSIRKTASSKNDNNRENLTRKANKLEEKIKDGDLFLAKIYTFACNNEAINNLSGAISSVSKEHPFWVLKCYLLPKYQLLSRYVFNDSAYFRSFPRKYNLLSSYELSHFLFPNYNQQQLELDCNIATLVEENTEDKSNNIETSNILYTLNNHGDNITFEQGKLNKLCFGAPGSGKSSSFIATELLAGFNKGVGIISTVYKQEEADLLIHLAIKNNRNDDLIIMSKNSGETKRTKWKTNIFETELRNTLSINNVLSLFNQINEAIEKRNSSGASDPFWDRTTNEYQKALISLMILVDNKFSLSRLLELTNQSIKYANSIENDDYGNKYYKEFKQTLTCAYTKLNTELYLYDKVVDSTTKRDMHLSINYFNTSFLDTASKTRESVLTVHRSVINYCNTGIIRDMLFADITENSPDWFTFADTRKGKIIILDIPVESQGQDARNFQVICKLAWQLEMLTNKAGKDVYYISDEFHHFISSGDTNFLSANRSYNVHNIFATQNYSQIEAILGDINTNAFLDNIQTKLFFKNDSTKTIDYAKRLIGDDIQSNSSQSYSTNYTTSTNDQLRTQVLAKHFQSLSETLPPNQAECIIFSTESFKKNKKHYLPLIYNKIDRFKPVNISDELVNQFNQEEGKDDKYESVFLNQNISQDKINENGISLNKNENLEEKIDILNTINTLNTVNPINTINNINNQSINKSDQKNLITKSEAMKKFNVTAKTLERKQKLNLLNVIKAKVDGKSVMTNLYNLKELEQCFKNEKSLENI